MESIFLVSLLTTITVAIQSVCLRCSFTPSFLCYIFKVFLWILGQTQMFSWIGDGNILYKVIYCQLEKLLVIYILQLKSHETAQLLNKPYVNEVYLIGQNLN